MNATQVEINGHPTWIEDRSTESEQDPVLLLHGGMSDSEFLLKGLGPTLDPNSRVVAFDRRGHGHTATHLVGYSDGGIG